LYTPKVVNTTKPFYYIIKNTVHLILKSLRVQYRRTECKTLERGWEWREEGGRNNKGSKFNSKSISWDKVAEDFPCH
jgi:short-subunit dehydrogenase involved in D-alanine esterification of teichoic acids